MTLQPKLETGFTLKRVAVRVYQDRIPPNMSPRYNSAFWSGALAGVAGEERDSPYSSPHYHRMWLAGYDAAHSVEPFWEGDSEWVTPSRPAHSAT